MFFALALALAAIGFLFGRRRGRARPFEPIPVLRAGLGLLALCFALIPLSGLLHVDALGWLGGLSLMVLLPMLSPLLIGYAIGWAMAARRLPLPRLWPAADSGPERQAGTQRGNDAHGAHGALGAPGMAWPERARSPQAGLLLAMAGVAAGFMIVIGAGYHLNGQSGPALLGQLLVPGLLLAGLVMGAALWRRQQRPLQPASRTTAAAPSAADPMRRWSEER